MKVWNSPRAILQNTSKYFTEHFSVFLQNTFQCFCRATFNVSVEHFLYFCRKLSMFSEHLLLFAEQISVDSQNTSQYFFEISINIFAQYLLISLRTAFIYFAEHLSVSLQSTYIYFCRKLPQNYLSCSSQI